MNKIATEYNSYLVDIALYEINNNEDPQDAIDTFRKIKVSEGEKFIDDLIKKGYSKQDIETLLLDIKDIDDMTFLNWFYSTRNENTVTKKMLEKKLFRFMVTEFIFIIFLMLGIITILYLVI